MRSQAWDYFSMSRNFQTRIWEACGGAPIVAAMIYAERMGANQAEVLRYANSGDTSGDHSRVVGYSADLFVKAPHGNGRRDALLAHRRRKRANCSPWPASRSEYAVETNKPYEPAASTSETLNQEYGAFVTLTEAGELRGCIGYTSPIKPLYITVRDTATLPRCTIRASVPSRPRSCRSSNTKSLSCRRCAASPILNRSRLAATAC